MTNELLIMSWHKVFVYGTLKRNEPNHQWFGKDTLGKFQFLGNAVTTEKYPLIIATKYNIPFVLYKPGTGRNVRGELYEVDDRVLANLDILEDHPTFYEREQSEVVTSAGRVNAWIYFIKQFRDDLLAQEMFESYSADGAHGLKYVESESASLDDL